MAAAMPRTTTRGVLFVHGAPAALCPHITWAIEAGEVECPLHATRFCLSDGKPMCLPATKPVRTHKVEVRGDEVHLFPGVAAGS